MWRVEWVDGVLVAASGVDVVEVDVLEVDDELGMVELVDPPCVVLVATAVGPPRFVLKAASNVLVTAVAAPAADQVTALAALSLIHCHLTVLPLTNGSK